MATREIWKTTELRRRLAEHHVHLSTSQVHRLVTQPPERLNLRALAALCAILECSPNDLLALRPGPAPSRPNLQTVDPDTV